MEDLRAPMAVDQIGVHAANWHREHLGIVALMAPAYVGHNQRYGE